MSETNWIQRLLNAIADLITRTKGLDDIHDDLAAFKGAELGNPVSSLNLLDHFNRKDGVAPDSDIWTVGGDAGYTVDMNVVDGEPSMIELATGDTDEYDAYMNSLGTKGRVFTINENGYTTVTLEVRAKVVTDTYISHQLGLFKTPPTGWDPDPADSIWFRFRETVGSSGAGTIWALNKNSATSQTDTTISVDTSWHIYKIVWTSTSIKFYIDGVEKVDHTTTANFPTAPLPLAIIIRTDVVGGAARNLRVDYVKVELS